MDRRRFLKYAAVGAAVAASGLAGYDRWQTGTVPPLVSTVTETQTLRETTTETTTPPAPVEISFYYDPQLTGRLNQSNPLLHDLSVNGQLTNRITAPSNATVPLIIRGTSSVGKQLNTATYDEPVKPLSLQDLQYSTGLSDAAIGLADGPATSPIKPSELDIKTFLSLQTEDTLTMNQEYPPGWTYTPNYFFYGARLETGGNAGQPHLAFDIQSAVGTPVHAVWGGQIVRGLYDWKFGIANEFGVFYYNHVDTMVDLGATVSRYDIVAKRNTDASHVHLEYRDLGFSGEYSDFEHSHPERILELFTTMKPEDLLKNPLVKDPVPVLPYFGP
jgi:murein DD-endopeptidase MepM/ murein hydrolase activator NlpD